MHVTLENLFKSIKSVSTSSRSIHCFTCLYTLLNVDIKNTDNVNVFKRKIKNWQGPIRQCGECLICIFNVSYSDLVTPFIWIYSIFWLVFTSFFILLYIMDKNTCACVNCLYCLPCKIKIVLLSYLLWNSSNDWVEGLLGSTDTSERLLMKPIIRMINHNQKNFTHVATLGDFWHLLCYCITPQTSLPTRSIQISLLWVSQGISFFSVPTHNTQSRFPSTGLAACQIQLSQDAMQSQNSWNF